MRNKYLHEMVIVTTLEPISLIPLWNLKTFEFFEKMRFVIGLMKIKLF